MSSQTLLFTAVRNDLIKRFGHIVPLARAIAAPVQLDSDYVAACALLDSITKKYVPTSQDVLQHTRNAAIQLFQHMNERCRDVDLDTRLCEEMRRIAEADFAICKDWQDLLNDHGLIVGPGASVLSKGRNSLFEKFFVNDLTTTNPWLYCEYIRYIKPHETFHAAERKRRHLSGYAFKLVDGSNMSTVPKTDRIDRTICTEPSLNMLFQRALGEHINHVLKRNYGYDPALQPDRNRERARVGSMLGSIATIDLSSASDTISMKLIERVFPTWVNVAICDCRSPTTILDGSSLPLNMVSTMGNGFTFPLQTYLFSLLVRAVCRIRSIRFERYDRTSSTFGVFGDDIIVPTHAFDYVIDALRSLGFIPNPDKSFNDGFFRESCGSDWYNGCNVRGVYCKRLTTINDRFSLINRLMRFSAQHVIALNESVLYLLPSGWRRYVVPTDMADDSGIKVPLELANCRRTRHGCFRYRHFSPTRKVFRVLFEDVIIRSHYNPFGFVIAAVASNVSNGLDRRSEIVRYRSITAFSPFWARECDLNRFGLTLRGWETSFSLVDLETL